MLSIGSEWIRCGAAPDAVPAAAHRVFTCIVFAADAAFWATRTCGANAFASLLVARRRTVAC